jgi:hypothetical protein
MSTIIHVQSDLVLIENHYPPLKVKRLKKVREKLVAAKEFSNFSAEIYELNISG